MQAECPICAEQIPISSEICPICAEPTGFYGATSLDNHTETQMIQCPVCAEAIDFSCEVCPICAEPTGFDEAIPSGGLACPTCAEVIEPSCDICPICAEPTGFAEPVAEEIIPELTNQGGEEADEETWSMVKDSIDPTDFKFYLENFPHGKYVVPAKLKLQQLTR